MAKILPSHVSRAWWLRVKPTRRSGFTLTELLIAVVVAGIIISTLLYLVVELLQINRREEVLTTTQQDMRRAIDYIARDAGEAVYIYSTPTAATDQLTDFAKTGRQPVLAFWRLDPLDPSNASVQTLFTKNCNTAFTGIANQSECNTLKIRQGYYTLVVYAQETNTKNDIWGGKSRIVRYELPKYTSGGVANLTKTSGYDEPTGNFADGTPKRFDLWKRSGSATAGNVVVLTDYVDDSTTNVTDDCPSGYAKTPSAADNFYVCVQQNTATISELDRRLTNNTNQTLIVFLRGNADTENAGFATFSDAGRLPTLKSEVLIRGVLDKQPKLKQPES
jgi:prepilin-type N-terminal cleavage/methylation domain-containing protein